MVTKLRLQIELTMESTTQVQVQNHDSSSTPLCVCGNEARTAYFTVEAMELGMVNLTAQVRTTKAINLLVPFAFGKLQNYTASK